jgi:hypothetical protein
MAFHGHEWGLRGLAARTLLSPVPAAGLAAPALAQSPPVTAQAFDPWASAEAIWWRPARQGVLKAAAAGRPFPLSPAGEREP